MPLEPDKHLPHLLGVAELGKGIVDAHCLHPQASTCLPGGHQQQGALVPGAPPR